MKYSNWIGLAAAIIIIVCCYLSWLYVPTVHLTIGGMSATGKHNFGRPGLLPLFLSVVAAINFLLPFIWAKRTNIFITGFIVAWAVRNYLLMSRCDNGDCPQLLPAFYIMLVASFLTLAMSFVPDIKVKQKPLTK
ncbi:MAG: hypothetical protein EAZ16_12305 [Sphingobacteriales bacterium]|nr:MAG: hypothetical protein EAZ16_12305 [Sphingobacteriales bacterium]